MEYRYGHFQKEQAHPGSRFPLRRALVKRLA